MAKILPTIGPATENSSNLKQVLKFSSFIRLNGSHNSISWHSQISKKIKNKTKILIGLIYNIIQINKIILLKQLLKAIPAKLFYFYNLFQNHECYHLLYIKN